MAYQKLQPGRSRPYTIPTFSDTVDNVALFDNPIIGLTATSGTPGVLTSLSATTFIQDKVQPGDLVQNATSASRGQSTLVKQVVSDTELILEDADAIFFPNNVFLITPPPSEPAVLNVTQSAVGGISLKITTSGGDDLTFVGLQSGSYLPVQTTRIWETVGDNLVENGSFRSGSNLIQNGSFKEIGPELITNGNFTDISEELIVNGDFTATGSELVVNDYFSHGTTDWSPDGGSTISVGSYKGRNDVAKINITSTANSNRVSQPFNYIDGASYKVTVEVYVKSGSFRLDCSNSFVNADFVTTSTTGEWQTLTGYVTAIQTGPDTIWLRSIGAVSEFYVYRVSVKQLVDHTVISDDLITNGDFSVTGSEQVPDGAPVMSGSWNGSNTVSGGQLTKTSGGLSYKDNVDLSVAKSWKVVVDVAEKNGSGLTFYLGGLQPTLNAGVNTLYLVNGTSNNFIGVNNGDGSIINSISVKELGEDWSSMDGAIDSYNENGVTITSINTDQYNRLRQNSITEDGKSYKVTYTIQATSFSAETVIQYFDGDSYNALPEQGIGTHTFYFKRDGTIDNWYFNLDASASASTTDYVTISSISVEETVTDWEYTGASVAATPEGVGYYTDDGGGANAYAFQTILDGTKNYKTSFEILEFIAPEVGISSGTTAGGFYPNAVGTFEKFLCPPDGNSPTEFRLVGNPTAAGFKTTNASVKEVGQGWTVHGSDADHFVEFPGVGARYYSLDASVVLELRQLAIPASGYGKIFKITANCAFTSASAIRVYSGGQDVGLFTEGDNTLYFIAQASASIQFVREVNTPTDVLITNVSVQEVGQDWSVVHSDMEDPDPHAYYVNFPTGYAQFIAATDTPVLQLQQNVLDATSSKSYEVNCNIDYGQGPDVVSNGDFSATINITIANYNFATGDMTGWNTSSSGDGVTPYYSNGGALISNGATGGQSAITQTLIFEDAKSYKISYRIVSNDGGGLNLNGYGVFDSTVGSHSFYIVGIAEYSTLNIKRSGSNVNIVITDIVVEELGEDWTFYAVDATNTISIESGGARVISAGVDISLRQPCLELGKHYKLSCDTTITTGKLGIANTTTGSGNIDLEEGYNEKYFTAASTQLIIKRITGVDNVLIDNITVQELDSPQIKIGSGGLTLSNLGQGDNTQTITDSAAANFFFLRGGGGAVDYNAKITDVTVRETGTNWVTYGSQVNFYNGYTELVIDSSNTNVGIYQEDVFQSGVKYRVDVTMKATASFDAEIVESNGASTITSIGTPSLTTEYQDFTYYFTGTGSYDLFIHRLSTASSADETIYIKSASVRQMADDTITVNALF